MVVKPDPNQDHYELWLIKPVLLGEADKIGTQRIRCEGLQFTNINSAAQHLLNQRGEPKLAAEQRHYVKAAAEKVPVKGTDIFASDGWKRFCERKKLDVRNHKLLEKTFHLSREELVEFGLKEPGR